MTDTTLRRTTAGIYGIGADAPYFYGLGYPAGDLIATIYSRTGAFVSQRGTLTVDALPSLAVCIVDAFAAAVTDGSFAFKSAEDTITTWDVDGETAYTYVAAVEALLTDPVYANGKLFWWEYPAAGVSFAATVYLVRANCDLTSVETVGDVGINAWEDLTEGFALSNAGVAVNATAALALWLGAGEEDGHDVSRITLAGGVGTHDAGATIEGGGYLMKLGLPTQGTGSVGILNGASSPFGLRSLPDDTAWESAAGWPLTDDWQVVATNAALTSDLGTGLIYGFDDPDFVVVVAAPGATTGSPTLRSVVSIDGDGNRPDLLFFMT